MDHSEEGTGLFDAEGRPRGPTIPEWPRPNRVELKSGNVWPGMGLAAYSASAEYPFGAELHIEGPEITFGRMRQPARTIDPQKMPMVRPRPDLLKRFFKLADASDGQIQEFAVRFGGLHIFTRPRPSGYMEYCLVWRCFAAIFQALQRIGDALKSGRSASHEDWFAIGEFSLLAERVIVKGGESEDEDMWCSLTHYLRLPGRPLKSETRELFMRLMNVLLGLAGVRSWFIWRGRQNRPHMIHSGESLISCLVFQLCLRILSLEVWPICDGCHLQYEPAERAPKAGPYRHFCPDCRDQGIPQKYAKQAYRARLREKKLHLASGGSQKSG